MHTTTRTAAVVLALGPILLAIASLAWMTDRVELRAILTFWAVIAIGVGLHGIVLRRLAEPSPVAHSVLSLMLAAGVAAAAGFSVELAMTEIMAADRLVDAGELSSTLILQLPGILFPLSLIGIAAFSWRHRTLPVASAALLGLAGASFPMSRIGEVAGLALISDLLLVSALAPVALGVLNTATDRANPPISQPSLG